MRVVVAPKDIPFSIDAEIFLAGSIEMGEARRWQDEVIASFDKQKVIFLNPRRDDWDATWTRSAHDEHFNEHVEWELESMLNSNIVFFYFQGGTQSASSLLELGLALGNSNCQPAHLVVVCEDDFEHRGNIEITCARFGISIFRTLEEGIKELGDLL